MKKLLFLCALTMLLSCSSDDDNSDRTIYDITYTVEANNGASINKIEYRDNNGDLIELTDVTSPWTINLQVRAGLGLEAAAYGDIPHKGSLSISANWTPEGGTTQNESQTVQNDEPNTIINNARVEISGRTLPD